MKKKHLFTKTNNNAELLMYLNTNISPLLFLGPYLIPGRKLILITFMAAKETELLSNWHRPLQLTQSEIIKFCSVFLNMLMLEVGGWMEGPQHRDDDPVFSLGSWV